MTSVRRGLDAAIGVTRGAFGLEAQLSIEPGETFVLLGPNGAGKSTVLSALAGLIALETGHIRLSGEVYDDPKVGAFVPAAARQIGVVFQDYLLFPHLSALENVAFGLRASGLRTEAARERAGEWLDRLDLSSVMHDRPQMLSGGQAQRVALARALAVQPKMLLLDEPLAALDVSTRTRLRRLLLDHLVAFPGPRLLVTHDPTEAFLMADQICILERGRVTQTGTAREIRVRPRSQYVADLVGVNHLVGQASNGTVTVEGHVLHIGDSAATGHVVATVHPRAISLHRQRPEGSPRNAWETSVARIENYGDRVRIETGAPLTVTAEVTPAAVSALSLSVGARVWVSIKATEIAVQND